MCLFLFCQSRFMLNWNHTFFANKLYGPIRISLAPLFQEIFNTWTFLVNFAWKDCKCQCKKLILSSFRETQSIKTFSSLCVITCSYLKYYRSSSMVKMSVFQLWECRLESTAWSQNLRNNMLSHSHTHYTSSGGGGWRNSWLASSCCAGSAKSPFQFSSFVPLNYFGHLGVLFTGMSLGAQEVSAGMLLICFVSVFA